jgi:putative SOS response-associated peptidase YedK
MCGRYTLTDPDPRILRLRFDLAESVEIEERPRFNVAPTDAVLAVRLNTAGEREVGRLRWGLVPEHANPDSFERLLINVRAETVGEAPSFKDAFRRCRCLILADGFYEWLATPTGKRPQWITLPEREPFAFAGLWARSRRADGTGLHSCAIVTTEPSAEVAPIHNRMPVILEPEAEARWLDPATPEDDLQALLVGREGMRVTEVSDAVSDVRQDGPHLLDPPLQLF